MNKERFKKLQKFYADHYYHGRPSGREIGAIATHGVNDRIFFFDGKKEYFLVDANSGCFGPVSIGYGNKYLADAIYAQAKKMLHTMQISDTLLDFYHSLLTIVPKGFNRYFLTTSGSAANEIAMRLAWKAFKKQGVIGMHHGFHGFNLGALAVNGALSENVRYYLPSIPHVAFIPNYGCYRCYFGLSYPKCGLKCAEALEKTIKYGGGEQAAAVIMEPIQGCGGHIFPPSKKYFSAIRKICDRYGLYLIIDEVQTAMGRTGRWFASEHYDIPADIITMGKGLGGGVPIGAVLIKDHVLKKAKSGPFKGDGEPHTIFSGTHSSDPLNAAAGIAVIEYIKKHNLVKRAGEQGKKIKNSLLKLQKRSSIIGDVRGLGLYIGVELVKNKKTKEANPEACQRFGRYAQEHGVYFATGYGPLANVIKIKPPLTITEENVDKIINVLTKGILYVEKKK